MNAVMKIFLSMSFSGGLLILALFLGKRFLKDKLSRQWQYYIWLVVVLRLLLPFGPEVNLLGKTYQAVDQAITRTAALPQQQPLPSTPGDILAPVVGTEPVHENAIIPTEALTAAHPLQDIGLLLVNHIWLVWLAVTLGLLIRKITIYQGFMRYINAGLTPVSDIEILDRLSTVAQQAGIKKPIELCVNPLVSSPLLTGFLHPCIVLPRADIPEKDFRYIALHELTHYKRRDLLYKWLVQATVCLHWFNPLVHLMSREITRACEFSCDEAVLAKLKGDNAQDYGKTLLDAMAAVGKYQENLGAVTLSRNKQLLKERLGAIMRFKKQSKAVRILTAMLTLCVVLGASFLGIYTMGNVQAASLPGTPPDTTGRPSLSVDISSAPAAGPDHQLDAANSSSTEAEQYYGAGSLPLFQIALSRLNELDALSRLDELDAVNCSFTEAEQYYGASSLPLFQIAFSRLDEKAQAEWLDRIYADRDIVFMGAAVNLLNEDCAAIRHLAETIYEDGDIAYFSILAMHMSEDTLEAWLARALEDEKWGFQRVLLNALDRDDEFEELNKKWAEAQMAEYGAIGVTIDGKDYYYQGQLVNIFLDIRAKSHYTLNMNPEGTVNIKIVRDENNEITGVAYMTDAEVTELFGEPFGDNYDDPDGQADGIMIPVDSGR